MLIKSKLAESKKNRKQTENIINHIKVLYSSKSGDNRNEHTYSNNKDGA